MRLKKISLSFLLAAAVSLSACQSAPANTETTVSSTQSTEASESSKNTESTDVSENTEKESTQITVTDMKQREVTLPDVPEKIVTLLASDVEILYALGAGDQIVGVGEYCDYPAEAQEENTIVTTGSDTNLEEIIALEPDVVIMGDMAQDIEQAEQLQAAGVPTVMTNANTIEEVYENIALLGQVSGKEDAATQLIQEMKDDFEEIKSQNYEDGKTIYFEISPLEYGLWTAGNNTFMQELCDIVNVENIFSDVEGWAEISEEQVLERDPDYIATVTMYYGEGPTPDEEILGRENWQDITAVKEKRVFCADNSKLTRPGPRLVEAARELAEFVHGAEE